MRILLAGLILVFGILGATAQPARIDKIDITEAGIFTADVKRDYAAPGTAAQTRFELTNIKLQKATTEIPAKTGLWFGVRFKVEGSPKGKQVKLRVVVVFPGEGLRNPKTGEVSRRDEYETTATVGETRFEGYNFESPWEEVPGTWTFQLWDGERKLAEQAFTVVKP